MRTIKRFRQTTNKNWYCGKCVSQDSQIPPEFEIFWVLGRRWKPAQNQFFQPLYSIRQHYRKGVWGGLNWKQNQCMYSGEWWPTQWGPGSNMGLALPSLVSLWVSRSDGSPGSDFWSNFVQFCPLWNSLGLHYQGDFERSRNIKGCRRLWDSRGITI